MSGIIGGTGSRSGVIGETEIDYEEGSWTPGLHDGGTSLGMDTGNSGTFGYYVKIGNTIHIKGRLKLSSGTMNSGTLTISLPIAPTGWGTGDVPIIPCFLQANSSVDGEFVGAIGNFNTNVANFSVRQQEDDGTEVAFTGTQFGSTGSISFAGHYFYRGIG